MIDWTGVRERVLALGAAPGSDRVFGAMGHGFVLDAPLTLAEVADLEAWLDVELPEDYRSFLLQVGAGGAGPAYGVFPVRREGSDCWRWNGDSPEELEPGMLAEPFPGGPDPEAAARILAEQPFQEQFEDLADLDAALETWEERLVEVQYDPRSTAGALCLSDEGCGLTVWLVVTGSERGRMWRDPRSDGSDLHPIRDAAGSPLDFAAWYLGWLTAAEAVCGSWQP
ncbi:SMI1/KNR4 family protein [Streptomyces sp. NPDC002574]|uniref:SMI1/KNR4 family protein n=1 Tax=Streptomyces sp. NPDC002574 TaxID=3364652 RepID=UPI0036741680